jgi:hypothetical protein
MDRKSPAIPFITPSTLSIQAYGIRPVEKECSSAMSRTLGDHHGKIDVRLRQGGMESTRKEWS